MLNSLVTGKLYSQFIVIEDSLAQSGKSLLQAFAHNVRTKQEQVHILCLENPIEKWKLKAKSETLLHDCFSDPQGWFSNCTGDDLQHVYRKEGLLGVVQEIVNNEPNMSIVCVDSLNPVIFNYGLFRCYRDLHTLLTKSRIDGQKLYQLVCLVHADIVPEGDNVNAQLRHLASTFLHLEPPSQQTEGKPIVHITHRKPGGRIVKQREAFTAEDGSCTSNELAKPAAAATDTIDPTAAVQSLASFRLGLEPAEMQARSQLVLPYTRRQQDSGSGVGSSSAGEPSKAGGQVFYQPDRADDWDEEDPDDDLDV